MFCYMFCHLAYWSLFAMELFSPQDVAKHHQNLLRSHNFVRGQRGSTCHHLWIGRLNLTCFCFLKCPFPCWRSFKRSKKFWTPNSCWIHIRTFLAYNILEIIFYSGPFQTCFHDSGSMSWRCWGADPNLHGRHPSGRVHGRWGWKQLRHVCFTCHMPNATTIDIQYISRYLSRVFIQYIF